jgi:hypothetical protein
LPCDVAAIHTAQVSSTGEVRVTAARRRDEASYRTAVDRAMAQLGRDQAAEQPSAV